jgi:hypothetical protein
MFDAYQFMKITGNTFDQYENTSGFAIRYVLEIDRLVKEDEYRRNQPKD